MKTLPLLLLGLLSLSLPNAVEAHQRHHPNYHPRPVRKPKHNHCHFHYNGNYHCHRHGRHHHLRDSNHPVFPIFDLNFHF